MNDRLTILQGDCLEKLATLPDASVHCCVTSPPYWGLRDYGIDGQLGLEKTPEEYVAKMVAVFREVKRVLRDDGTLWLNLGDSYASNAATDKGRTGGFESHRGSDTPTLNTDKQGRVAFRSKEIKGKDLVGIPWMTAFALRADGWYLRSDIIWHKPNPMPESVTDRPTKSHEYIFLLSKCERYFYDNVAVMEAAQYGEQHANKATSWGKNRKHPNKFNVEDYAFTGDNHTTSKMANGSYGRNKRSVWTVTTSPYSEAHFATYPPDLIKPCIMAGTSAKGCCPQCGSPWERIVETDNPSKEANVGDDMSGGAAKTGNPQTSAGLHRNNGGVYSTAKTLGWEPACDCGYGTLQPCTILDPFAGSGTTGEVAIELGRNSILIELNPEYVRLIEQRTNITPGLQLA